MMAYHRTMSRILSLAAGTLPEFGPAEVAAAAGRAGFAHVGFTIEPSQWDRAALQAAKSEIAAHQLSVLDVEVVWIPEGGAVSDDHRRIIEAGAELGAANVLVVSSEPDIGKSAAALHQLCAWAAPANMRVSLEFLMITAVQSMPAALAVIDRCDHPAAALLIDTLHFRRAGHRPDDLAAVDPALFAYSQICDGNRDCADDFQSYLTDAVDLRSCPGEGELPLAALIRALPANLPLSLEIRSKAYRDAFPDPAARARAVFERSRSYLEREALV
jgi:sugar phosphate isomerase/epimerase